MTHAQAAKLYRLGPWQNSGGVAACTLAEFVNLAGAKFEVFLYFSEQSDTGKPTEVTLMGEGSAGPLLALQEMFTNQLGPPTNTDTTTPMINWAWDRQSARLMLMIVQSPEEMPDMMEPTEDQHDLNSKANCSIRYISALTTK